jgi:hypothetical protein
MATLPTTPPAPPDTPTQVLEDYPLYREWKGNWLTPGTLSRDCRKCQKETTWKYGGNLVSDSGSFKLLRYNCVNCGNDYVYYLIVIVENGPSKKVGQIPMQLARIPNSIAKRLGDSAPLYQKALTCRNEGYGLAAVAYFRRVVEDKTNELIDVVADAAEAHSVPAVEVSKVRGAKNEKTYEDKLRVAAHAIPEVLRPHGANPFQAMHDILSVGIHTKSEEECLQIADDTREIFDYLFDRLRTEIADRTTFVSKVKAIASRRGARATS